MKSILQGSFDFFLVAKLHDSLLGMSVLIKLKSLKMKDDAEDVTDVIFEANMYILYECDDLGEEFSFRDVIPSKNNHII